MLTGVISLQFGSVQNAVGAQRRQTQYNPGAQGGFLEEAVPQLSLTDQQGEKRALIK